MKSILIFLLSLTVQIAGAIETQKLDSHEHLISAVRASEEKVQLFLAEIQKLKKEKPEITQVQTDKNSPSWSLLDFSDRHHDPRCDDQKTKCVPHCKGRNSSGNCYNYGPDYCGIEAVCSPNCTGRNSSGNCYNYGEDKCGSNLTCVPNCASRNSSGNCYNYGEDFCGPLANCISNCLARNSSGDCYNYGPDICY